MRKRICLLTLVLLLLVGCGNVKSDSSKPTISLMEEPTGAASQASSFSEAEPAHEKEAPPVKLGDTGIIADFRVPESQYMISNIIQDKSGGLWAVLYATTNYDGDVTWMAYNKNYASLHVQLFDEQGAFVKHIPTELAPITNMGDGMVKPSDPCTFQDRVLTFFSGWTYYVFLDTGTEEISMLSANNCIADGEYLMLMHKDTDREDDVYLFQLYEKRNLIREIALPIQDLNFTEFSDKELSFDAQSKTAVYSNYKITYTLDFGTGAWTEKRDYSELLGIPYMSNDKWEIYISDEGSAGDGFWADMVSLEKATGNTTFLQNYYGGAYAFGPDDTLLTDNLQIIDLSTGQIIKTLRLSGNEAEDYVVRGVGYDSEKDLFLIARSKYLDWNEYFIIDEAARDECADISLDVYDRDGRLLRSLETGLEINLYHMYWIIYTDIELDGHGNAVFKGEYLYEPYVRIRYRD